MSSTFESVSCALTTSLVTFPKSTCPQLTPFHVPLPYPVAITCKESAQTELFVQVITSNLPASADCLREYRGAWEQDNICSQLIAFCNHGSPNKDQLTGDFSVLVFARRAFPPWWSTPLRFLYCGATKLTAEDTAQNLQRTQGFLRLSPACFLSCLVARHQAQSGATSEELPSLHPSKSSSQAAHDLLSPPKPSLRESYLRLVWTQWQNVLTGCWLLLSLPGVLDNHHLSLCHSRPQSHLLETWHPSSAHERQQSSILLTRDEGLH